MNFLTESISNLLKEHKEENKPTRVVNARLEKVLKESIKNLDTRNLKSEMSKASCYERALKECLEGQFPDKHWTDITSCNIYSALINSNNDTDAVIHQILVESKVDEPKKAKASKKTKKTLNESKSTDKKSLKEAKFDTLKWPRYAFQFDDGFEIAASDSDEAVAMYTDILENRPKEDRPLEEIDKIAQEYYDNDDEFSFNYFTDDELALLWKECCLKGKAYDDEVYEAISNRPNRREIFDKYKEEAQKLQDEEAKIMYGADKVAGSDFDQTSESLKESVGKYITKDIVDKTKEQSLKNAYDKGELSVLSQDNVWYTEGCPNRLFNTLKKEMKRLYPNLNYLYSVTPPYEKDESLKESNDSVIKVKVFDIDYCVEPEDLEDGETVEEIKASLPKKLLFGIDKETWYDSDRDELISDCIGEETGWLVYSFDYEVIQNESLKEDTVKTSCDFKTVKKNAVSTAKRDGYNQVVRKENDGSYSFHRDYPSANFDGDVVGKVKVSNNNGVLTANYEDSLTEDTVKQGSQWVNKGKEGTHGKFKTKKAADAQRKAMFANGYKESLKEEFVYNPDDYNNPQEELDPQRFVNAAYELSRAFSNLEDLIDLYGVDIQDWFTSYYPFDKSFDEEAFAVENWAESMDAYFSGDNEWFDESLKESVNKKEVIDAIMAMYGSSKKEAEKQFKEMSDKRKELLVKGFKDNAKKSFLTDSLKEAHADLSDKTGTLSHAIRMSADGWANARTKEEAISILTKAIKNECGDSPAVRGFLAKINNRPLYDIIKTATNYWMSGADLSMGRGKANTDKNFRKKSNPITDSLKEEAGSGQFEVLYTYFDGDADIKKFDNQDEAIEFATSKAKEDGGYAEVRELVLSGTAYKVIKTINRHVEDESLNESKTLTEGTSNFWSMYHLPLLVWEDYDYAYDVIEDRVKEQMESDEALAYLTGDEWEEKYEELLEKEFDNYENSLLDESQYDELKADVDEHNRLMNDKYYDDDNWSGQEVEIKPGYYEGCQLYVYDKDMSEEEFNDQLKFFEEMRDKYGLEELEVAYRFDNGETGYTRKN